MTTRILALAALFAGAVSAPAAAQDDPPDFSIRPLVMFTEQRFSAGTSFDANFGDSNGTFWGGGVQVVQEGRTYLEFTASQFKKTGQQAFLNNGQAFRLNIPMQVTITPIELTGGYRYRRWTYVIPYGGGGVGFYHYKQTSDFATPDENVDQRHIGLVLEGGAEIRVHRWVGVAADLHYTHIPGILGNGGISQLANEKDLGGVAARFRVIVGR